VIDPSQSVLRLLYRAPIHLFRPGIWKFALVLTCCLGLGLFQEAYAQPGPAAAPQGSQGAPDQKQEEEDRKKEAEEAQRLTELYLRNQSVFLRKGELMLEMNTFYNRNSFMNLVPINGGAAVVRETRRFFDTTLIARYGILTDGLELDVIAPVYIRAEAESDFGVGRLTERDEGFGDLRAALRYQLWYERGNRPSLVIDVEGKSRTGGTALTGTGTWNTGGGITLIKTMDPVVFFGRVGYTHNFSSQTRNLGDIVDYRIGMGFSLNDRVSFNVQLTGAYIGAGSISTEAGVVGAIGVGGGAGPLFFSTRRIEMLNVIFTTTVLVTKELFIEPFVGVGLTEQSFTIIGIRIPYRLL
jgi:hypothetical protein